MTHLTVIGGSGGSRRTDAIAGVGVRHDSGLRKQILQAESPEEWDKIFRKMLELDRIGGLAIDTAMLFSARCENSSHTAAIQAISDGRRPVLNR
jgi:hypothetical protein